MAQHGPLTGAMAMLGHLFLFLVLHDTTRCIGMACTLACMACHKMCRAGPALPIGYL